MCYLCCVLCCYVLCRCMLFCVLCCVVMGCALLCAVLLCVVVCVRRLLSPLTARPPPVLRSLRPLFLSRFWLGMPRCRWHEAACVSWHRHHRQPHACVLRRGTGPYTTTHMPPSVRTLPCCSCLHRYLHVFLALSHAANHRHGPCQPQACLERYPAYQGRPGRHSDGEVAAAIVHRTSYIRSPWAVLVVSQASLCPPPPPPPSIPNHLSHARSPL